MVVQEGNFRMTNSTTFSSSEFFYFSNQFFHKYIKDGAGIDLKTEADPEKAEILFQIDTSLAAEGYRLTVNERRILLEAADKEGIFYGVQTIRQLLPAVLENGSEASIQVLEIPSVEIMDAPKFRYRGMHLDVARHFFSKEFIKEYISYLAMLKMNYFHWHLTEDQGWRIEIEQFPRLTSHAAYRDETLIGHYNDTPQTFDGQRYGGYYSKKDIKEIVSFAKQHYITIIPEIEMPGHAQAAISAYPELGCSGEQVPVATKWGVFENIYCPNQKTFAFLKGVLTEVMDLFPGNYIHIGGDEAPKKQWKQCAHCQKLIQDLNLKDEHELQSWFIKEIETFLNDNGKKMIGWDEILEGGLAPNATVMSWRGTQGGIEAAKSGHNVIMTPTSHAYFDYYQSEDPREPLAIGGYLPLEKVYAFNPVPDELDKDEASYILGAQGNVWTEYMKTEEQVEYMIFPRILAMSEVLWSGPSENIEEDYPDFAVRVLNYFERLDHKKVNYSKRAMFKVNRDIRKDGRDLVISLRPNIEDFPVLFSIDGDSAQRYESPLRITGNTALEYAIPDSTNMQSLGYLQKDNFIYHKGLFAEHTLNIEAHPSYSAGGIEALNNGILGSDTRYGDSEWLGFWGDDLEIQIDVSEERQLNNVKTRFYHAPGQWIYSPKTISISQEFVDGTTLNTISPIQLDAENTVTNVDIKLKQRSENQIRKLVIRVPNYGVIPDGKQGAGNKAWTFIDEIIIQ